MPVAMLRMVLTMAVPAAAIGETCSRCHGENAVGGLKDLRWMSAETRRNFSTIVLESTPELREKGMQPFKDLLNAADVEALNGYLVARANEDYQDHIATQAAHPQ